MRNIIIKIQFKNNKKSDGSQLLLKVAKTCTHTYIKYSYPLTVPLLVTIG